MIQVLRNKRTRERMSAANRHRERVEKEMEAISSQAVLASDYTSSSEDETHNVHDPTVAIDCDKIKDRSSAVARKRARLNIISAGVAAALDRTKVTSRNATFIISEIASSLGHDVSSFNINKSSIHRTRALQRATISNKLRSEFSCSSVPLSVHWDGKLMEDLTFKKHVDRLPVLISGIRVEQLLGVPKLLSGTGEEQAAAVVHCLEEWGVVENVVALCFDTTAANTGHLSGACSLIERKLERRLLFMACRHHIMELVVGAAFEKTIGGASTGPEILPFKRFQEHWQFVDQEKFQPASTDPSVEVLVSSSRADILEFANDQLKNSQPRDDYLEFVELSIIFIGGVPARGIHFRVPGAMHRARWMAKIIYAIKMWLFRDQLHMAAAERRGIRDLAVFAVLIHLRAWMTAPLAVEAPLNDFMLMGQLLRYHNAGVSTATSKKLGLHLWYLSEELIGLALFDSRISIESKKLMLAAMQEVAPDEPPKRPRVESHAFLGNKGLERFCTVNSKRLFQLLKLPETFLSKDPSDWHDDPSFQEALGVVKGLAVVNDRAERGVALIQDYNKKLTRGEEQLQFLLQVVTDHRRQFPDCSKKTIVSKTKAH